MEWITFSPQAFLYKKANKVSTLSDISEKLLVLIKKVPMK